MTEPSKDKLTVKEGFQAADYYSGKASEIARQLGLAGIAIIWVFKTGDAGNQRVPGELIPPGLMLVVGLALDLMHYVISHAIWYFFTQSKFGRKEYEFTAPSGLNVPGTILYIAKIISITAAYIYLIGFLFNKVL